MNAKLKIVSNNPAVKAAIADFGKALKDRQEHRAKVAALESRVAELTSALAELRSVKPLDTSALSLEEIRQTAGDVARRQSEIDALQCALASAEDRLSTVRDEARFHQIEESGCREQFHLAVYDAALEELQAVMPTLGVLRYCQALTGKTDALMIQDLFTDDSDAGSSVQSLLGAPA